MRRVSLGRQAKAALRILKRNGASPELIERFTDLAVTSQLYGTGDTIKELVIDACRKFDFSEPFCMDGQKRHFRSRLLDKSHHGCAPDCHDAHSSDVDLGREQAYRRGFDQGFSEARYMIEHEHKNVNDLKSRQKEIHAWRIRPLQIVGSRPGADENFENCFVLPRGTVTLRTRYEVLKRDKFRCKICGRSETDGVKLHVDHKISLADGGTDEIENLQTLCEECNLGKSSDSIN